jgi:hypothetical protein
MNAPWPNAAFAKAAVAEAKDQKEVHLGPIEIAQAHALQGKSLLCIIAVLLAMALSDIADAIKEFAELPRPLLSQNLAETLTVFLEIGEFALYSLCVYFAVKTSGYDERLRASTIAPHPIQKLLKTIPSKLLWFGVVVLGGLVFFCLFVGPKWMLREGYVDRGGQQLVRAGFLFIVTSPCVWLALGHFKRARQIRKTL